MVVINKKTFNYFINKIQYKNYIYLYYNIIYYNYKLTNIIFLY